MLLIIGCMRKNDIKKIKFNEEYEGQLNYLTKIEERNKIAQELHDKVGHTISSSIMQLEATKFLIDKDINKSRVLLESTIKILREGMDSIRLTFRNIKPPVEVIGVNRVETKIKDFSIKTGIEVSFKYKGELSEVTFSIWKIINENLEEALTNIMKYSKASRVDITMEILNKIITFKIKDDGIGFEKLSKGLGIRGMEERIGVLDGRITVDGTNGVLIVMIFPIERS